MKFFSINVITPMSNLCAVNYKIVMKEIKDLNKLRDTPWASIGSLKMVNMPIHPKLIRIYNPNQNPSKI